MSSGAGEPDGGAAQARRVVLVRALPDTDGTSDHTVHLVAVPLREHHDGVSGVCGTRLPPGQIEIVAPGEGGWCTLCVVVHLTGVAPVADPAGEVGTAARVGAALAYRELGWPVRVRGEQVSLNLDLDVDAVALVSPAALAGRVAEILVGRRCPPAVLAHPALPNQRVVLAGERYGVPLDWPVGVHRVTGTLLLPPSVTAHGVVRWVRPPEPHALKLCREIDVCAALATAVREPPPSSPSVSDCSSRADSGMRHAARTRAVLGLLAQQQPSRPQLSHHHEGEESHPMTETRVPLTARSLRFAVGMFHDMTHTRDITTCHQEAAAARAAAATSPQPLLCLARAAWWAAVADRRAASETADGLLTGTNR